jgi:hypothetical protein
MFHMLTTTRERPTLLIAVAGLVLVALYLLAIDQGHLLALVQGQVAFDQNLLHEFVHDARHAAGFPCH